MRYVVSFDLKRPKQDDKRKAYLKITKTLNGIGKKVVKTPTGRDGDSHWTRRSLCRGCLSKAPLRLG